MTPKGTKFENEFSSPDVVFHSVLTFYNGMIIMAADARIGFEATIGKMKKFKIIGEKYKNKVKKVDHYK